MRETTMKRNPTFIVLAVGAAVLLAGCSAKSPTAPPQPTPTAYGISLTASPSVAGINESILLVAQLSGTVPDGTSVTFTTTIGQFAENGKQEATRTTSGGRATATLVTLAAGDGTVTARVPNKSDTAAVHFRGGSAAQLAISSVLPNRGKPQGGDQVVIRGQGFLLPLDVNFIVGGAAYPATIVSVAGDGSSITVLTPQIPGSSSADRPADVQVILRGVTIGGQPVEVTGTGLFTFSADTGVPLLYSVVPSTGSVAGGDIIVLNGKNFTEPLMVEFIFAVGSLPGQVVSVQHRSDGVDVATVVTPKPPVGTTFPATVSLKITNLVGNVSTKNATYPNAFQYLAAATAAPAIYYISPTYGSVDGGETVMIFGRNFDQSARVMIGSTEAQVVSVSADGTLITVVTRPLVGAAPAAPVDVTVTTTAGSATLSAAFTYLEGQSPEIYALSPNQGPLEGGTRVTITGKGFQYPVQVLFGDRQAQVVSSNYNQVVCTSPSVTAGGPATPLTVTVTVTNLKSGKVSGGVAFRYGEAMYISGLSPVEGPADVATTVTISGQGFVAPVSVMAAANVQLQWDVKSVSGTEIVAMSKPIPESARTCSDIPATITVTNLGSNISAVATQVFTYRAVRPLITSVTIENGTNIIPQYQPLVSLCNTPWNVHTVTVHGTGFQQTGGFSSMTVQIGDIAPVLTTYVDANTVTLTLPDLTGVTIRQIDCVNATNNCGKRFLQTPLSVTIINERNSCRDTLDGALVIQPCDTTCRVEYTGMTLTAPGALNLTPAPTSGSLTIALVGGINTTPVTVDLVLPANVTGPTQAIIPANAAGTVSVTLTAASVGTGTIYATIGSGPCQLAATASVTVNP